jgi:hypothetical protein
MEIISKELLSEVLGIKIRRVVNISSPNKVDYDGEIGFDDISIYELAHRCKEWADKEAGYSLNIHFDGMSINPNKNYQTSDYKIEVVKHGSNYYCYKSLLFDIDNEPEAVFKACEWLLDNKDNK